MLLPDQGSASSFPSPENAARPSPIGRRFPGLHGRLPMVALFGAMGILGASIILLRTSVYGVGIGADEVRYISMARNLADGNGFQNYAGEYRATLPPLFPALLAVAVLFGLDAPDAARFVNAAAFGLTVCLSGLHMAGRVKSRLLAAGVAAAILVSPNLMYVSSSALAGGPYLLLALLSLTALDRHLRGGGRSALLWAAVFASLSVVTRLAGVLLAATGVLTLLFAAGNGKRSLKNAAIYALVTAVPISAWMLRNVLVAGSVLGRRPSVDDPSAAVRTLMQALLESLFQLPSWPSWIVRLLRDVEASIPALTALALAALALAYAAVFRTCAKDDVFWKNGKTVALFGTFFAVHTCGLISILLVLDTSITYMDRRHHLPSWMAFLFVTALLLDRLSRSPGAHGTFMRRVGGAVLAAALFGPILPAAAKSVRDTKWVMATGDNKFSSKRWRDRPTIRYIDAHAIDGCILSNVPDALYVQADVRPAALAGRPGRVVNRSWWIGQVTRFFETGCDVHIVWFGGEERTRLSYDGTEILSLLDARLGLDAEVLLDDPDGRIWRLSRPAADAPPSR